MNGNVVEYYSVIEMNYWYMSQHYAKWKPHQMQSNRKDYITEWFRLYEIVEKVKTIVTECKEVLPGAGSRDWLQKGMTKPQVVKTVSCLDCSEGYTVVYKQQNLSDCILKNE